ncbi:hypothetical protein A2707_00855 [Candidatus Saccharibacteria bacterium RIFCSPHIGHO2_01_FULL_45_15]|nr:MAG: hypothetical protein A2707_00855 [Candidatus Saccharibacteria bacterium RIFCSPHIGHO2_01_FULL_45_15]OGL26922.1 MAG: hypothetical protein A3C39_01970 [Candidatus Saccharibacteria bacterium RIFCSPHIGHO2_02_FULL_46_12]OGL32274.1 MAG: hypothetical protein A3E76_02675 [Candidatus Saccharibacteria bacterium RIFCSPHIGHO2_12_FULL_44_22]
MNKPYKNIDQPVVNLHESDGNHYIPPLSRDPDEITYLQDVPLGTKILAHQSTGLNVSHAVVEHPFQHESDRRFAFNELSKALFNSSWYLFAQGSQDVMRRRLLLPELADDDADWRETPAGLLARAQDSLGYAAELGQELAVAHASERSTGRIRTKLGRQMGNSAILLSSIDFVPAPRGQSAFDISYAQRLRSLDLLRESRTTSQQNTIFPSVAQIARSRSPLSVAWQDRAPQTNEAYRALDEAQDTFGLAA